MNESEYEEATSIEIKQERSVPLEERCIECGDEALGMCSCCGLPLCGMHEEIQAGFCSDFTTVSIEEGQKMELNGSQFDERVKVRFLKDLKVSGCYSLDKHGVDYLVVMPPMHKEEGIKEEEDYEEIEK